MKDYDEIVKRHEQFWTLEPMKRPLIISVGDWVDGPRLIDSVPSLPTGRLKPEDINPKDFVPELSKIQEEGELVADDKIAMVEPLSPLPWMEAYFGCAVYNTDRHIWSHSDVKSTAELEQLMEKGVNSVWQDKYFEFFDVLRDYSSNWTVSQPILRGLSDIAAAILGTAEILFAMYDEPELMQNFYDHICRHSINFFRDHLEHLSPFHGGYVLGQFHVWSPGKCLRVQDDAMAVMSPALYQQYVIPRLSRIAALSDYTTIHLHLTCAPVLDQLLAVPEIRAVEYGIDEGAADAAMYVDTMKKIQDSGKPLILKARFTKENLDAIMKKLDCRGLCLVSVVRNKKEALNILDYFGV
jgi:hypothetical protein